jgi:hypothetical protein
MKTLHKGEFNKRESWADYMMRLCVDAMAAGILFDWI